MNIEPITITELNLYIKNKIASDEYLNSVYVSGEISNFKLHYTGHMYFTLKDDSALIKCVMFKTSTGHLNFVPKDGMKVVVLGTVGVYERDGVYQIYCKAMKEEGIGDLHKAYEELKAKLEKAGYFDMQHKKAIPLMPNKIGVLTSKTGSVIRDIINVSTRRNPNVNLRILPVPVQGIGAGEEIAKGIKFMNEKQLVDVIILARGGGSLEDLWPFNEEVVANAIYESKIPIISAVGHETDFTIADFVSDLRASTPSVAAELAVADTFELLEKINKYNNRYKQALLRKIQFMKLQFEKCMSVQAFKNPFQKINELYLKIDGYSKKFEDIIREKLSLSRKQYIKNVTKIDTLSPLKTLARGYCLTKSNNKIVKSVKELSVGDTIELTYQDGTCEAKII